MGLVYLSPAAPVAKASACWILFEPCSSHALIRPAKALPEKRPFWSESASLAAAMRPSSLRKSFHARAQLTFPLDWMLTPYIEVTNFFVGSIMIIQVSDEGSGLALDGRLICHGPPVPS